MTKDEIDELERRAWTRGFFSALAYHCEGTDREEGIRSSGLLTPRAAIAGGAEKQDVQRMLGDFRHIAGQEAEKASRLAKRAARSSE